MKTEKKQAQALAPKTFAQWMQLAEMMAKSNIVPKEFKEKPGDCLVAMQMGAAVGISPFQAIQSIAVINGRPCMWGDAVLGIVWASGICEDVDETDDGATATCTVKRKGKATPVIRSFSMKMAGEAKVYERDNQGGGKWISLSERSVWRSYPARMRQMRARSWALRDAFPDVLKGLAIREEVEDYGDTPAEPKNITPGQSFEERVADLMPREKTPTFHDNPALPERKNCIVLDAAELSKPAEDPGTGIAAALAGPAPENVKSALITQEEIKVLEGIRDRAEARPDLTSPVSVDVAAEMAKEPPRKSGLEPGGSCRTYTTRFTIGKHAFETAGITRAQMLKLFTLCPAVGKKLAAPDAPQKMLRTEFKKEHRADLTEDEAERYMIRLQEILDS